MEGNTKSPKRCRHGTMRRDNSYVEIPREKIVNKLRAEKLRAEKLKKLDKK